MNKKWMVLPVVLLAVFGLLFLGCDDGKGSGSTPPPAPQLYDVYDLTIVPDETTEDSENETAGTLEGEDFQKILAAKRGSYLELTVDTSNHDNASAGPGWGIGSVGNFTNEDGDIEGAYNLGFTWPAGAAKGIAKVQVDVKEALRYTDTDDDSLYVNIWAHCTVNAQVKLYDKKTADAEPTPPPDGVIAYITVPEQDGTKGKGKLGYIDVVTIKAAPSGSFLRIYTSVGGSASGGWGMGTIGGGWDNGNNYPTAPNGTIPLNIPAGLAANDDFYIDVDVDLLLQICATLSTDGQGNPATWNGAEIIINPSNVGSTTKIELRSPVTLDAPIVIFADGDFVAEDGEIDTDSVNAEVDDDAIKVAYDSDESEYRVKINFDAVDISTYGKLVFDWEGIVAFLGDGASFNISLYMDDSKKCYIGYWAGNTGSQDVPFSAIDTKYGDDAFDDTSKSCVGIEFHCDFWKGGDADGDNTDTGGTPIDLIINSIQFEQTK